MTAKNHHADIMLNALCSHLAEGKTVSTRKLKNMLKIPEPGKAAQKLRERGYVVDKIKDGHNNYQYSLVVKNPSRVRKVKSYQSSRNG